ncbi:MAG TPA: SpoIIE family protein phosphatase, partial [Candidatus Baltobacteraceae bacterium]|nr:SpoIIE family protein phosphatase [Candidatus Baltobacteraceae bacterium]
GALTLVVGDLWAKGAQGAYYAFRMRRAFRRAASESASPASILSALNDTLADDLEAHGVNGLCSAFVTTFSAHGNLICAAAGAEAAILFRDRDKHEHLGATGPLAGIERGAFFAELELAFSSGDALVAFTDGITESRFAGDEQRFLGTHGLVEIVRRVATARVLPAPRDVFREIEMWNGGNFRDDATLAIASPAEAP